MITEVPELEFYDYLPPVWDETRVLQAGISQCAVIARRRGTDWFIGAMNAGTTRTFNLPLDFLTPAQKYILNSYFQDASVPTRTQVRIDRSVVESSGALSFTLDASRGQAWRVTPAVPPAIQSLLRQGDGRVSLTATGNPGLPYSLWAETNLAIPAWALLTSGLINTTPFTYSDDSATNRPQQFYRFSTP
jgi:hypothetical protein